MGIPVSTRPESHLQRETGSLHGHRSGPPFWCPGWDSNSHRVDDALCRVVSRCAVTRASSSAGVLNGTG